MKVVAGEHARHGDGLGREGSPADTYLEMIKHNTTTIVENLR